MYVYHVFIIIMLFQHNRIVNLIFTALIKIANFTVNMEKFGWLNFCRFNPMKFYGEKLLSAFHLNYLHL